ncbi:MAG: DUF92 domain-containing protein [Thermoplasmata archaeon]
MVLGAVAAGIGIAATVGLAAGAVLGRALTRTAGIVAAAFGIVIVVGAGFPFLTLLVLFVVSSAAATRYRFEEKRRHSVQEGVHGERGVSNVIAHIVIPTGLVVYAAGRPGSLAVVAVLYASALAFGAADTFASEFGVLAGHARSILTLRSVPPGTNGGVSGRGEAFALIGAAVTAGVGFLLFSAFRTPIVGVGEFVGVVALSGFLGCQVDSCIGASLENRGILGKGGTNFVAMLATVVLALGLLWALGGVP